MESFNMIACDMGASNGRVVHAVIKDGSLVMKELHRFPNEPQFLGGIFYWDFLKLMQEIETGLKKAAEAGIRVDSIGLNSWGNTVGLLDRRGDLLMMPYHYRDVSPYGILDRLVREIPFREQFEMTLFKPMKIQPTVFLKYLAEEKGEVLNAAGTVLMISDLFNYFLSGKAASEMTMAATSQMFDMRTLNWNSAYASRLKIPMLFPNIIENGTALGPLKRDIADRTGLITREGDTLWKTPMVVAVAGHDTAAASGCVDMERVEESLYLSCGTWCCMGCAVEEAIEDPMLMEYGMTNDLGLYGRRNLRFNHTGLWILQECKREWGQQGSDFTWDELMELADQEQPFRSFINTEAEIFFRGGRMTEKVQSFCRETGQQVPETRGAVVRTICESLALRYRYSRDCLELFAEREFACITVLGGGSANRLLCRFTADALGIPVWAGPAEASVCGNIIQQAVGAGVVQSIEEGWRIIDRSWEKKRYDPQCGLKDKWNDIYAVWKPAFGWL